MKILRTVMLFLIAVPALISVYAVIAGKTYLFKAIWYNFAKINDYKIFTNNTVPSGNAQPWKIASNYNKTRMPQHLQHLLTELGTVATVVIKNDSLLFEEYHDGYNDSSYSGSFSMAKSITSLLIGAALKEGKLKSIDEPVGNYLPEFKNGDKSQVKIVDLLTMSSGSNWDESYNNPFSVTTELYYGDNVYKTATGIKIINKPGTLYSYKSGDTQLLGLIIEKATGKSLSAYASEKLWKPLGAEHAALWSVDHRGGYEKAYCCFNTNARDFARIGQLMLDSGKWNGHPIITTEYFQQSVHPCAIPDINGKLCNYYGFQWWLVPYRPDVFYAKGILGQYIIVIPSKKEVIVRLGKHRSSKILETVPEETDELIKWGLVM